MEKTSKIYIARHKEIVGSAIWREPERQGSTNLVGRTRAELELLDRAAVNAFYPGPICRSANWPTS